MAIRGDVTLRIDKRLREKARELNINLSRLLEQAVRDKIDGIEATSAALAHWDHDCESCRLIGTLSLPAQDGGSSTDLFDIYVCPQNGHPTIVARYGNEGPEYISGNRCPLPGLELRLVGDLLARKEE